MTKRAYGPKPEEFHPLNPSKCRICGKIIARSSWEREFMKLCDLSSSILEWGSEVVAVKYQDKSRPNRDGSPSIHTYYVDFYILVKKSDGTTQKYWIEIKPQKQVEQPKKSARKLPKTYLEECKTWIKNTCKWKAAKQAADARGIKFMILTEKNMKVL